MRLFITFACLFLFSCAFSQATQPIYHGTYVIVAFIKKGIVISSDSRTAIVNINNPNKNLPDAYFDSSQKVFQLRNFALATLGRALVNDTTYETYFRKFADTLVKQDSLIEVARKWRSHILTNYPKFEEAFFDTQYLLASYENRVPTVCLIIGKDQKFCASKGVFEGDSSGFDKVYKYRSSPNKVARQMEKYINEYAVKNNKEYIIGGPVSVLLIKPNNKSVWLRNKPKKQYMTASEMWKAFREGKTKVYFPTEEGRNRLKRNWSIEEN